MDHSTYHHTSSSPETKMESMPETDLYATTGWTDAMFMPGTAPFSPVMSDTNQSAYTLATSDVSFAPLGPSLSQEMRMMDTFLPNSWSAEQASNTFFVEPATTEPEMFSFPTQGSDVAQPTYHSWFTPTEATAETYFAMDPQGQAQNFAQMVPQTAGFVGNPVSMAPLTGFSNPSFHAGHGRVDSLYSQASPRDVAVSVTSIPSETHIQDTAGPRRMTVPVTSSEPIRAVSSQKSEQDVPYGAPIQQYRTYAPGYPSGSTLPFVPEVPVLGSNASVSSASSVAPSVYEESPRSPAVSVATPRTRVEDNDGRARTDPLYSAKPSGDGNYHCPFVAEGCQHKATKLKCNYECVKVPSSTRVYH